LAFELRALRTVADEVGTLNIRFDMLTPKMDRPNVIYRSRKWMRDRDALLDPLPAEHAGPAIATEYIHVCEPWSKQATLGQPDLPFPLVVFQLASLAAEGILLASTSTIQHKELDATVCAFSLIWFRMYSSMLPANPTLAVPAIAMSAKAPSSTTLTAAKQRE
jgi:hypothetical protein